MPKKPRVGKQRRDKYYRLAKESGYRSRAAFKLVQLNRKYQFLQKCQVLVDLCAAPGGWSQVASQNMPISSLIIAVDLVPIRPVRNVLTLQGDIRTDECRRAIEANLKGWSVDCVLNDGSPNLGKNWTHDAFAQAQLTLHALKLTTFILKKGGWFVTKLFRSKDYMALVQVLQKLFTKVVVTKPQASRTESAEIFVLCSGYTKPEKIDPNLLNPKMVFRELQLEPDKLRLNVLHPEKRKKPRAEGYAEGDFTMYHPLNASEFVNSESFMPLLSQANEVVLDEESIMQHPKTTPELKECLKDIQVLGKRELKLVLVWRKEVRKTLLAENKAVTEAQTGDGPTKEAVEIVPSANLVEEEDEQESTADAELKRKEKRKARREGREKRKLRERYELNMLHPGDRPDFTGETELFDLRRIYKEKKKEQLIPAKSSTDDSLPAATEVTAGEEDILPEEPEADEAVIPDEEELLLTEETGLSKEAKSRHVADLWFQRDIFDELEDSDEEIEHYLADASGFSDDEQEQPVEPKAKKRRVTNAEAKNSSALVPTEKKHQQEKPNREEMSGLHSPEAKIPSAPLERKQKRKGVTTGFAKDPQDSESSKKSIDADDLEVVKNKAETSDKDSNPLSDDEDDQTIEIVPQDQPEIEPVRLNPEGLALGTAMLHSSKARREILEFGFHRYANNDENLPDWFIEDEKKNYRKLLPISKETLAEARERQRAIDARPIKKVAEAQARKRRRAARRLDKARTKAERVTDDVELNEREKASELKKIYKAANVAKKKPNMTYVVSKKHQLGKKPKIKGPYKKVDARLKKDTRAQKAKEKKRGSKRKNKQMDKRTKGKQAKKTKKRR